MPWKQPTHKPKRLDTANVKQHRRAPRPNARQRGYDHQWEKRRADYAATHPAQCVVCGYMGLSHEMHLDHRTPREQGGTDEDDNLQWLCGPKAPHGSCHSRKTAKQDGGFGNKLRMNNMT